MFETLAVVAVALLAVVVVFLKARERLKTPGARRSRPEADRNGGHDGTSFDSGDAGGGDGGSSD